MINNNSLNILFSVFNIFKDFWCEKFEEGFPEKSQVMFFSPLFLKGLLV